MTPAGLRSLFRYHRQTTGVKLANPHRFRHYAEFRIMPSRFGLLQRSTWNDWGWRRGVRFRTRHSLEDR